ncbi:MAG TPA: SDR family oxidoreductase [Deinococcales bacterium]|nr:SDR family oxidoreductase [Deinococcales bacterium]
MSSIKGKTALVTGGSKGIGLGIAEALVREGLNVTITARSEEQVEEAAAKLNEQGPGRALGLVCDVRSLEEQQRVTERTVAEFGQLDVVIANAGVGGFGAVDELDVDTWNSVIDTNLTGVFYTVKATVGQLKANRGYLMTVASLAGTNFFAGGSAYNASKFGLVGFTQAAMLDLRHYGVKTTTIMPGSVASYFNDNEPGDKDAWKIQPEDMGEMVLYLLRTPEQTLPSKIEVRPTMPPKR